MKRRKFFTDCRGFTYVDLLVYMGVILILSLPAYQLISRTLKGYEGYMVKAEASKNKTLLYASLKQELSLISPPWWMPLELPVKSSKGYRIPWYDGEKENALILKNGDKGFYIISLTDNKTSTQCFVPDFTLEELAFYDSPNDIPSGWLLEFSRSTTDDVEFHIPMSRLPL